MSEFYRPAKIFSKNKTAKIKHADISISDDIIEVKKLPRWIVGKQFVQNVIDLIDDNKIDYSIKDNEEMVVSIEEQQLVEYFVSSFFFEHWYEECKSITFKSLLIPVSAELLEKVLNKDKTPYDNKPIDTNVTNLLAKIQNGIDKLVEETKCDGVFVRLNCASPKDLLAQGKVKSLCCKTAEEVIKLISTSDRLRGAVEPMKKYNIPIYIVLREFKNLDNFAEFRLIITGGELRAVSQNFAGSDKYVSDNKQDILQQISSWVKLIKSQGKLPYDDCVLDIAIKLLAPKGEVGKTTLKQIESKVDKTSLGKILSEIWLVEFNSYGSQGLASAGLYNWNLDEYELCYSDEPSIRVESTPI